MWFCMYVTNELGLVCNLEMRFDAGVGSHFTYIFPLSLQSNPKCLTPASSLALSVWLLKNREPLWQLVFSVSGSPPVDPNKYGFSRISPWAQGTQRQARWETASGQSRHARGGRELARLLNSVFPAWHVQLEEEVWAGGLKSSCKVAKRNRAKGLNFISTRAARAEGKVRLRLCLQCQKKGGEEIVCTFPKITSLY